MGILECNVESRLQIIQNIYCQECGGPLSATRRTNNVVEWIEVTPCPACLREADLREAEKTRDTPLNMLQETLAAIDEARPVLLALIEAAERNSFARGLSDERKS